MNYFDEIALENKGYRVLTFSKREYLIGHDPAKQNLYGRCYRHVEKIVNGKVKKNNEIGAIHEINEIYPDIKIVYDLLDKVIAQRKTKFESLCWISEGNVNQPNFEPEINILKWREIKIDRLSMTAERALKRRLKAEGIDYYKIIHTKNHSIIRTNQKGYLTLATMQK
ncbi:hypothetical protein M2139_001521 [Enterococcus sp. PF1-24]|uniref:hypothetical protein n=1 Tax=unclassified Enterococcus TaxID=2608891 RepID=UPI00247662D4|nr:MULTISPECIES: hypothetical protein [unclassified Enterococcus]MDH6364488.1 hypothetical protein [Enterococcus sp. PFB1-1]MDH6401635.1 hypothetical protein [Enterococcus sp. PF1-24]